ncbi:hypothetical protein ACHAWO_001735 [Cyclotella atomus]|uniref:Uncharacterized protein n=1 Tax=Cyclotella atomus TaxID=382360 RepID=A0ABD3N7S0_9STRA
MSRSWDWRHLHLTLPTKPKNVKNLAMQTGFQLRRFWIPDGALQAEHLLVCKDPGRTSQFNHTADELAKWMSRTTDPDLLFFLMQYIRGRGVIAFLDLPDLLPHLITLGQRSSMLLDGETSWRLRWPGTWHGFGVSTCQEQTP